MWLFERATTVADHTIVGGFTLAALGVSGDVPIHTFGSFKRS